MSFILHVTFVFGLLPQYAFSTYLPDWSIGLEMQFYLVFPLVYWWMRRWHPLAPVVVLTTLSYAVGRFVQGTPGLAFPEPSFLPLKLPLFLAGMLVAEAAAALGPSRVLLAVAAVGLGLIDILLVGSVRWLIVPGFIALLVGIAVRGMLAGRIRSAIGAVLGNQVMRFLGDVSYSVYLFQPFAIALIGSYLVAQPWFQAYSPPVRVLWYATSVVLATYAWAYAMVQCIERPGIRLGGRVARALGAMTWPRRAVPLQARTAASGIRLDMQESLREGR